MVAIGGEGTSDYSTSKIIYSTSKTIYNQRCAPLYDKRFPEALRYGPDSGSESGRSRGREKERETLMETEAQLRVY